MRKNNKIKIRKSLRTFYIIALVLIIIVAWLTLYRTALYENNAVKKSIYEYKNNMSRYVKGFHKNLHLIFHQIMEDFLIYYIIYPYILLSFQ